MYNLICFPHYTSGGLLTDILNNHCSETNTLGGLSSIEHNIGKIGDSNSIFTNFTQQEFDSIINKAQHSQLPDGTWLSTHCWPGNISVEKFNKIILVTTATYKSKIYRWARAYHYYYKPKDNITIFDDLELIDKHRQNAKNYLQAFCPLYNTNVYNIEFSEIVEETVYFTQLIDQMNTANFLKKHMENWKKTNIFLYSDTFWNSFPVIRYYEAEYETHIKESYIYK